MRPANQAVPPKGCQSWRASLNGPSGRYRMRRSRRRFPPRLCVMPFSHAGEDRAARVGLVSISQCLGSPKGSPEQLASRRLLHTRPPSHTLIRENETARQRLQLYLLSGSRALPPREPPRWRSVRGYRPTTRALRVHRRAVLRQQIEAAETAWETSGFTRLVWISRLGRPSPSQLIRAPPKGSSVDAAVGRFDPEATARGFFGIPHGLALQERRSLDFQQAHG